MPTYTSESLEDAKVNALRAYAERCDRDRIMALAALESARREYENAVCLAKDARETLKREEERQAKAEDAWALSRLT